MTSQPSSHDELKQLVASAKFLLAETFDPQTRVPKDFNELAQFHKKTFPDLPLSPPPKDLDIAILSFSELPLHRTFLSMLEQALRLRFGKKVKVVAASQWEQARFLIAPDYGIAGDPSLSKLLKEGSSSTLNFLGSTPLFLLNDPSLYMKEPKLKSSLWKALCLEIGSLK